MTQGLTLVPEIVAWLAMGFGLLAGVGVTTLIFTWRGEPEDEGQVLQGRWRRPVDATSRTGHEDGRVFPSAAEVLSAPADRSPRVPSSRLARLVVATGDDFAQVPGARKAPR